MGEGITTKGRGEGVVRGALHELKVVVGGGEAEEPESEEGRALKGPATVS
jgi:hypothetical protein